MYSIGLPISWDGGFGGSGLIGIDGSPMGRVWDLAVPRIVPCPSEKPEGHHAKETLTTHTKTNKHVVLSSKSMQTAC